jgi:hypothetical protein
LPDATKSTDSGNAGGSDGGDGAVTYVYAHSSSTLYRVDPDTLAITMVGPFVWSSGSDQMTDIAIDKNGQMLGVSFTSVYKIDPTNAHAMQLSNDLQSTFNGLSFVPATQLGQTGDDVLVATRNSDGKVFRVDPMTGVTTQIGDMGTGFVSSGDLVAVNGLGTLQTTGGGFGNDQLARLAPQTFKATAIGSDTGFGQIWGVAYWKNKVYGFTNSGQFVLIDPNSGIAMMVTNTPGISWWGAAVTTLAPVIQ